MFTGIIETVGTVVKTETEGTNRHIWMHVPFVHELKVDQSIAHNGVCLTIVEIRDQMYKVTAIEETLRLTNLNFIHQGELVNIERCMPVNGRFDGHIVQGHVDGMAQCEEIETGEGSWTFTFCIDHPESSKLMVPKGSVCVNGISLTLSHISENRFSVSIIPYTYHHTNLSAVKKGDWVNIEFDILGKYIARQLNK